MIVLQDSPQYFVIYKINRESNRVHVFISSMSDVRHPLIICVRTW